MKKSEIHKRAQYIRIINKICHPNYNISWNQLKKKALIYYIHQSDAYIKAYVQQHL